MGSVSVAAAREAAARARLDVKDGRDPRQDVRVYAHAMVTTGGDHETAADAAWPVEVERQSDEDRRRHGPWEWRDLVDLFLEEKRSDLDPGYFPAYASYLRHKAFDRIARRPVREVTATDLQGIRNTIVAENSKSAAARAVRQGREMMDWAWSQHSGVSGLAKATEKWPLWRDQWTIRYKPGKRRHAPEIDELARTLAVAERYRTLGQTEHATAPGTLAMLWFTVLTGQRTGRRRGDGPLGRGPHPGGCRRPGAGLARRDLERGRDEGGQAVRAPPPPGGLVRHRPGARRGPRP